MKKRCLVSLWGVLLTAFLAIFLGVSVGAETYNGACGSQLTWSIGNTQTVASHDFSSATVTQNNISFGGVNTNNVSNGKLVASLYSGQNGIPANDLLRELTAGKCGPNTIDWFCLSWEYSYTGDASNVSGGTMNWRNQNANGYKDAFTLSVNPSGQKLSFEGAVMEPGVAYTVSLTFHLSTNRVVISIGGGAYGAGQTLRTVTLSQPLSGFTYFYMTRSALYCADPSKLSIYIDNIRIDAYKTDELYICGTGAMEDYCATEESYGFSYAPWYEYRDRIRSVRIESGVTSVGREAFSGCRAIESVSLPLGLSSIGADAFFDCRSLSDIQLPSSLTSLGADAFYGCIALSEIVIPNGVTTLEDYTFYGCTALSSVVLPSGLTSIGQSAFARCINLKTLQMPSCVKSIASSAFVGCTSLVSLALPSSMTYLGDYVFYGCKALEAVSIPSGVTRVGDYVFYECRKLSCVTLPKTITEIGKYAFGFCIDLKELTLPEGVTRIGESAFSYCSKLENVTVPKTVISIENMAFSGCVKLSELTVLSKTVAFSPSKNTLYTGITLCGYPDSTAEEYAKKYKRDFVELHDFSSIWTKDENAHWHVCTDCGSRIDEAEHGFDNACDTTCDTCGYTRVAPHSYKNTWDTNEKDHWHECSLCGDKKDMAEHGYDNVCDPVCNTCGYTREVQHNFDAKWETDESKHWNECSKCGLKKDEATHTFDTFAGTVSAGEDARGDGYELYACATCNRMKKIAADHADGHFFGGENACACGATRTEVATNLETNSFSSPSQSGSKIAILSSLPSEAYDAEKGKMILSAVNSQKGVWANEHLTGLLSGKNGDADIEAFRFSFVVSYAGDPSNISGGSMNWRDIHYASNSGRDVFTLSFVPNGDGKLNFYRYTDNKFALEANIDYTVHLVFMPATNMVRISFEGGAYEETVLETFKYRFPLADFTAFYMTRPALYCADTSKFALYVDDFSIDVLAYDVNGSDATACAHEFTREAFVDETHPETEDWYKITCSVCGAYSFEQGCEALGHAWAATPDAEMTVPSTCKTEGKEFYPCLCCGEVFDERPLPLGDHGYDTVCDPSCNVCDHTRVAPHDYKTAWDTDENGHWHECSLCGDKKDEAEHSYTEDRDATCDICGYERAVYILGDMNEDGKVNSDDAIYLLRYTLQPNTYPIVQSGDMNGDGKVNSDDAIYLLRHTLRPNDYPLIEG